MIDTRPLFKDVESRLAKERQREAGDMIMRAAKRNEMGRVLPRPQVVPNLAQGGEPKSPVVEMSRVGRTRRIKPPAIPIIPPDPAQQWRVIFEPFGNGPPTIARVKRVIKNAYRSHKLKCVRIECLGDAGTLGNSTPCISPERNKQ